MANKNNIKVENNILQFVYNDRKISIDLDQLEMVYIYKDCACFYGNGKRTDVNDVFIELLEIVMKNSNFVRCGHYHLINVNLIDYIKVEKNDFTDKYYVVVTFKNGTKEEISTYSWVKANQLYTTLYNKWQKIKYIQELTN